jgi:uncharacterized OB-fold protein
MMTPNKDDPLVGQYWKAAEESRLEITWCPRCNTAVWYPAYHCPSCRSGTEWQALSGRASLVSWTSVEKPVNAEFQTPYIVALVSPVEAPHIRLVTQLVDCKKTDLVCDMPVFVRFEYLKTLSGNEFKAPVFAPHDSL